MRLNASRGAYVAHSLPCVTARLCLLLYNGHRREGTTHLEKERSPINIVPTGTDMLTSICLYNWDEFFNCVLRCSVIQMLGDYTQE